MPGTLSLIYMVVDCFLSRDDGAFENSNLLCD